MSSQEKSYKRVSIIVVAITITILLGTVSYAFYQTTINGRVSGTIAQWSFTANDQTSSFDLNLGELYPGKSGTYNITLSAESSELDVYYELVFGLADVSKYLYLDSAYTKPLFTDDDSYIGKYGVIPKGTSVTVPLYLNWPYGGVDTYQSNLGMPEIRIIARQYTGYSGSIPMNLTGLNLVSYNNTRNSLVVPVGCLPKFPGYIPCSGTTDFSGYKFETINSTSGYMVAKHV
ncbi:MAG: hypothetical protein MR265_04205 [Erysipelotrichaceae bacterium]|nr:hypothetical protein [Erysipelotrichaceae bacterium]